MYNKAERTALLFFSKTAKHEADGKKLSVSRKQTQAVARVFIQNTQKILRGVDLPNFHFSEENQHGDTFGERLQNAFNDVFEKGFTRVIAVGNDCLNLDKNHLLQAINQLETTPSVFGPTTDGGVYLLGFQKENFESFSLKNIDWQTENVFSQLTQTVDNQCFTLEILTDIDNASDLVESLKNIAFQLRNELLLLFKNCVSKPFETRLNFTQRHLLFAKSLRAPPYLAF